MQTPSKQTQRPSAEIVCLPTPARVAEAELPTISVIMVSYMTGPALLESVRAVLADPDITELVLIDNGNPSSLRNRLFGIAERRVGNSPRLRLYQGHGNIGFGPACNYGASLAKGECLLFLNPDAVIEPGAARRMVQTGRKVAPPWLVGGLLLTKDGHEQRGGRRGELTFASAFASFTPAHRMPGLSSIHWETQPRPANAMAVPTLSGACLMTDRASFEAVGGFDEGYFLHVEDIDICRRVRALDGTVLFEPRARIMHYGSTSEVPRWRVEWHKLKGFLRYFWNSGPGLGPKLATVIGAPLMAAAILGRAAWLTIRTGVVGR